jgi:hypothetical protein
MIYDKIRFDYGSPVEYGYRILDTNGVEIRITDLDGNTLNLTQYGYICVLPNPLPSWAT